MLYDTFDNPKLIPFKDEQEEQQIKELRKKARNGGRLVYENALQTIGLLHDNLLRRYIGSFADKALEGILGDLNAILGSITLEMMNASITEAIKEAETFSEDIRAILVPMGYDYKTARVQLQQAVMAQLFAIDYLGGDTMEAEAIISKAAAALYPPIDGEDKGVAQILYPVRDDFGIEERGILNISDIKSSDTYLYAPSKVSHYFPVISSHRQEGTCIDVGGGATVTAISVPPEGKEITADDREVLLAVADLVRRATVKPLNITPAQIYRALSGKDSNTEVKPETQQKIIESMDKLLHTEMTIDFRQQLEKHVKMKRQADFDYSRAQLEGYAISGYKSTRSKGYYHGVELQTDVVYIINAMPLIVEYSRAIGQVAQFSKKYLTTETVPTTPSKAKENNKTITTHRLTMIKRSLAAHIERMKSMTKRSKGKKTSAVYRLTYEKIAEDAGLLPLTPETRRRLRDTVDDVLESYTKTRPKLIAGYQKYKDGRSFTGVEIIL